ncbi:MAG: hypothetical protein D6722_10095 [Bacteroidetes bacterium]|nr:MAG: hypothetical protein D6722_10095 [Bacteroidota bacterium]
MAKKGLDSTFVHYGVRKEDMALIEALCQQYDLDFEWVKEDLLRSYHERRVKNQDIEGKGLEKLIDKALQKIK